MNYRIRIYVTPEFQGLADVPIGVDTQGAAIRATSKTDASGYATIKRMDDARAHTRPAPFLSDSPSRLSTRPLSSSNVFYVTLFNHQGKAIITRKFQSSRLRGRVIAFPLTYEQALAIQLVKKKPRRSAKQKQSDLCDSWSKLKSRNNPDDILSLCLANQVLTLASGGTAEKQFDEIFSKTITERFGENQRKQAMSLMDDARKNMKDCWPENCPDTSAKDWAEKLFMEPGAPGAPVIKALNFTTPDPRESLVSSQAGPGIGLIVEPEKICLDRLDNGDLSPETVQIYEQLQDGRITLLADPSINLIEVWAQDPWLEQSNNSGSIVRLGEVGDEMLTLSERLLVEDASITIDTNVELDSPEALILQANEQGMQQFFVDVKPGQVVSLKGSGFVSSVARVTIQFRRIDEGDDSELLTFLDQWESQASFDLVEMDVFGSNIAPGVGSDPTLISQDQIAFQWPDVASTPGIYRIEVEFRNESEHYLSIESDPGDCSVSLIKDGVVAAPPIYMVVPPAIEPKNVRIRATSVHCIDETDPEPFFADDTIYQVSSSRLGMQLQENNSDDTESLFTFDEIGETIMVDAARRFWNDGELWQANLQAYPDSALAELPFDEMVVVTMNLLEVDSAIDQVIIRAALTIALIAFVLFAFFVMAALIVLLIATGVIAVSSFGAGAALTVIVAAVAAALTGVFFGAIMAIIAAIVAAVPTSEVIAASSSNYSGLEMAHRLAKKRIHRILWPAERPLVDDASLNTRRISSGLEQGDYTEVFRADNLGGRYDLTAAIHTE